MPKPDICSTSGAGWDEAAGPGPACDPSNADDPSADEEIAAWLATSSPPESSSAAPDTVCAACGYEGPMIAAPDGDRALCPACGDPWQDRGGILLRYACPDCGRFVLLTEQHRGKTVICPGCHAMLGCLIGSDGRRRGRGPTIFDLMALAAAFALGYVVDLALWERHVPSPLLNGVSAVVLPVTWTLVALRMTDSRPSRRRRFHPPGLAACLAVAVASAANACWAWDVDFSRPPVPPDLFAAVAVRALSPLAPATAVAATWSLLMVNRGWRPDRNWMDRLGRSLGLYWLAAGLLVPLLRAILG